MERGKVPEFLMIRSKSWLCTFSICHHKQDTYLNLGFLSCWIGRIIVPNWNSVRIICNYTEALYKCNGTLNIFWENKVIMDIPFYSLLSYLGVNNSIICHLLLLKIKYRVHCDIENTNEENAYCTYLCNLETCLM